MIGRLLTQLAGLYDFVVVDTAGGFGELTAAALDVATHTLLVTTPEPPTLRRTELGLRQLADWKYPETKLRVVLNRASLRTGMRSDEMAAILSQPIDWWLPNEPSALQAAALGQPVMLAAPKSQVARSVRAIARQLGAIPERPRRSIWPFLRSKPVLAALRA
jgi:pilus assembly protein CpaE